MMPDAEWRSTDAAVAAGGRCSERAFSENEHAHAGAGTEAGEAAGEAPHGVLRGGKFRGQVERQLTATGRQHARDHGHAGFPGAGRRDVREVGAGRGVGSEDFTDDAAS
jgi:hypothetical protein